MEQSACVSQKTGWQPCHFTVWQSAPRQLLAAMPFYLKTHSYGEYVFDWAWANAYQENGLNYYPKMLSAIPFTPVAGTRILGNDPDAAKYLLQSAELGIPVELRSQWDSADASLKKLMIEQAFDRYFDSSALMGTPDICTNIIKKVEKMASKNYQKKS
jgi:predicted N-acyltransferase